MKPMKPMKPMQPMEPLVTDKWWDGDLGEPASSGAQNEMRYAFFPNARRLLLKRDGKVTSFDTGDHHINGVAQSNGPQGAPTFRSAQGEVPLSELKQIQ